MPLSAPVKLVELLAVERLGAPDSGLRDRGNETGVEEARAAASATASSVVSDGVEPPNVSTLLWEIPGVLEAASVLEKGRRLSSSTHQPESHGAAHGNSTGNATEHGEGVDVEPQDVLPFLFTSIAVGTALVHLATIPRFSCLQQTVMLFILGMAYSLIVDLTDVKKATHGFLGVSHHMWMNIEPHLLLAVMLPLLITGDSISIDTTVAKHVAKQCLFLAGPGVVICSFGLALFFWVYIPYDWPFMLCLTMSSILAATDPVAVVSLLKELGASPALTVQIQGESLLNDGTAMVLFTVAYDILRGQSYSFGDVIIFLVKSAVCAVLLGGAIGMICTFWIKLASNRLDERSSLIQISITLCCAYWSWIMAEGTFHVSGVLCTVASALVLADKMWPSIASKEAMHHVWHTFEHIGNSTIFFVAGSLTGHNMVRIPYMDYVHLVVIYLVCTVVRGAMIYASIPALNSLKHSCTEPVTVADATVMCWGGLRGALGLALAIKVNIDGADGEIKQMDGERVLFYVGGVALLTLIVNATTCPALVKWLRLNRPSGTKQMMMLNIQRQMEDFASDQAVSSSSIGNHVHSMLSEVQESIIKSIDKSTMENIQKMTGDESLAKHCSTTEEDTSSFEQSQGLDGMDSDEHCANTSSWRWRFSWRPWSRAVVSRKRLLPHSSSIIKRLQVARKRLLKIPKEELERLDLTILPLAKNELDQLVQLLEQDGDFATSQQMKPINDVFLSLVRAKYWASIEADDFIHQEGRCLLESITGALGRSSHRLMDLFYIRRQLLKSFGEEDPEVRRGVAMEGIQVVDSALGGSLEDVGSESGPEAEGKSCNCITTSILYNTLVILVIFVTCILCLAIAILSNPITYQPATPGEYYTMHSLFSFFIVDFLLRLCALKSEIFTGGVRKLDAFLTLICLFGNVMEILRQSEVIDNGFLGSPHSEVIRALMVLQLLRVHQLFKSLRTIRMLRRLATGSAPKHLAGRLQVITILTAFTKAHYQSQEELIKYFGKHGKVGSGIVARCIVESLTQVCEATWIAWRVAYHVNPAILNCMRTLRACIGVTEDLCKLVEDAHHCGAMTEQDADSVLHPLKTQQMSLREMVHDTHRGVVPATLNSEFSRPVPPKSVANSDDHAAEIAPSKWGIMLDEHNGSPLVGGLHGPEHTPRIVMDACVQTEDWLCGVEARRHQAEKPLQSACDYGERREHRSKARHAEDSPPKKKGWTKTARPPVDVNDYPMMPNGKDNTEIDLNACEGWSVSTADDLAPPRYLPGPSGR